MERVNIANVIDMLVKTFKISEIPVSFVTNEECELHDTMKNITSRTHIENRFTFEDERVQLVEPEVEDEIDINYEYNEDTCDEGKSIVVWITKLKLWNIGKTQRRCQESIQHRFKKLCNTCHRKFEFC